MHRYYAPPKIQADFTAVKIDKGDYDTNETAKIMDKPKIYGDIISEYKRLANGKQTIIYCCNVAHSVNTAAEFNNAGIKTAHVDGTTPKDERKRIFDAFKNGKITALTNCNLFSEGIDITGCECCLLLRPTLSLTLYIQSAMRCMRYAPGKTAIIIDCVGNVFKHDLPDAEREWSLTATKKQNEQRRCKTYLPGNVSNASRFTAAILQYAHTAERTMAEQKNRLSRTKKPSWKGLRRCRKERKERK